MFQAPLCFMTDNSSALKGALGALWASASQLLCHFHVSQAEWRWLLTSKNGVPAPDRKQYLQLFREVSDAQRFGVVFFFIFKC